MKLTEHELSIVPAIAQTLEYSDGLYQHSLLSRTSVEIKAILDLLTPAQWMQLKSTLKDTIPCVVPQQFKDCSIDSARIAALIVSKERRYHQGVIPGQDAPSAPSVPLPKVATKKEVKMPLTKKKVVVDLASSWGS